jgi:hypothetical protein
MTFAEIHDNQGRILRTVVILLIIFVLSPCQYFSAMEEFGEECTVVFASIVTKPGWLVRLCRGEGVISPAHRLNMEVDL